MRVISIAYCINKDCKDYGIKNIGNIHTRGMFGKNKDRQLFYCKTCGKRFSESRVTAFFGSKLSDEIIQQIIIHASKGTGVRATGRMLNIDKDAVNRILLKADRHCEFILSNLLASLKIGDLHIDKFMSYVNNRKLLK